MQATNGTSPSKGCGTKRGTDGNSAAGSDGIGGVIQSPTTSTSGQEAVTEFRPKAIKASDLKRLLEKQNYKCALTGDDLTPETASLDHAMPVCRGGGYELANLQIVHCSVNAAKGTMTNDEFIAICRKVAANNV